MTPSKNGVSFAKTGAAPSPAIAPSQELMAVMIVIARRLNIRRNVRSAACLVPFRPRRH
jgi:hypothetical protein